MNSYDDLRKELAKLRSENERVHGLLDDERLTNKDKSDRNRLLQEKLKEQLESCDKKSERIKQLKCKLKEFESREISQQEANAQKVAELEQSLKLERENLVRQQEANAQKVAELEHNFKLKQEANEKDMTDLQNKFSLQKLVSIELGSRLKKFSVVKIDACTETHEEYFKSPPIYDNNKDNQHVNTDPETNTEKKTEVQRKTKAESKTVVKTQVTAVVKTEPGILVYKCQECGMSTKKKSTFDDHKAEFCVTKPVKDMVCPVCNNPHTRRSLRIHLGGLIRSLSSGRQLQGKHKNYTLKQHQALLAEVKSK